MKRRLLIPIVSLAALILTAAPAAADITAFFGVSPTTSIRSASGFAVGFKVLFIGLEFEYAHIGSDTLTNIPGVGSGMFNLELATPTKTKLYLTAGGGVTRENLGAATSWGVGTNIGGGVKLPLAGPIKLRVDYRVFTMHHAIAGAVSKAQQRIYAGLSVSF